MPEHHSCIRKPCEEIIVLETRVLNAQASST